jgi:hypothetical protein
LREPFEAIELQASSQAESGFTNSIPTFAAQRKISNNNRQKSPSR